MRQNRTRKAPKSGSGQKVPKLEKGKLSGADQTNTGDKAQEPQYKWVMVEHRDADGNPTLPKELIAGTYLRRYGDVPHDTEMITVARPKFKCTKEHWILPKHGDRLGEDRQQKS